MFEDDYQKPKKVFSRKEAKLKAADYCAYQERSQQEVRDKLYSYGLHYNDVEEVLSELITENFINEERFAKAYAGGKFRMKKWGRLKILQGLKQHRISEYCIKKGLQEIPEGDYLDTIETLISKKRSTLDITDEFAANQKIASYLYQKGFETNLIWEVLRK